MEKEIFSYKGYAIVVRSTREFFQTGFRCKNFAVWPGKALYLSLEEAETAGVSYMKVVIDRIKHGKMNSTIFW